MGSSSVATSSDSSSMISTPKLLLLLDDVLLLPAMSLAGAPCLLVDDSEGVLFVLPCCALMTWSSTLVLDQTACSLGLVALHQENANDQSL